MQVYPPNHAGSVGADIIRPLEKQQFRFEKRRFFEDKFRFYTILLVF